MHKTKKMHQMGKAGGSRRPVSAGYPVPAGEGLSEGSASGSDMDPDGGGSRISAGSGVDAGLRI